MKTAILKLHQPAKPAASAKSTEIAAELADLLLSVEVPPAPASPEPAPVKITDDGYAIDDQGEILGVVAPNGTIIFTTPDPTAALPFCITTPAEADWALDKIAAAEAELVAVDVRRQAVLARLELEERAARRRLDWMHRRFDRELTDLARGILTCSGWSTKTCKFTYGQVSFRTAAGTNAITDMDRAVAVLRDQAPDKVKTVRTVTVTDALSVKAALAGLVKSAPAGLDLQPMKAAIAELDAVIESTGPRETVSIETGVEAPVPKKGRGKKAE